MRIAQISDLHVRDDRLEGDLGQAKILNRTADDVARSKPDLVLVPGDLSGNTVPHKGTPRERNAIVDFLGKLADVAPTVVVAGNHDFPGDWSFLNSIRSKCGLYYVEEEPETIGFPDFAVLALPWVFKSRFPREADYAAATSRLYAEAIDAAVEDFGGKVPLFLAAHTALRGAKFAEGQPAITHDEPIVSPDVLCREDVFACGVFGHYHFPQTIRTQAFGYPGSLFVGSYGEEPTKGWVLYDTVSKVREFKRISQAARLTLELDPVRGEIRDLRPHVLGEEFGFADLLAWVASNPSHVKISTRFSEDEIGTAKIRTEEVRAKLAEVALSVFVAPPEVDRTTRVREGAVEVAAETTLEAKLDRAWDSTDPSPTKAVRKRALALLEEISTEFDGGRGA